MAADAGDPLAAPTPAPAPPGPRLTVALSKGRILDEALPLLARAGLAPAGDIGRLLRVPSQTPGVDLLIIRPTDVPTYVEYGAADLGLVGKDILIEHGGAALYEPLDLHIARCRMAVAAPAASAFAAPGGWPPPVGSPRRLTVATKYPVIARDYFAGLGVQVELIKLYGSMELAPLVGLADVIVDLVATGGTLKANGLAEIALIRPVTTRVVVNRAAMKRAHQHLQPLIARLAAPG